MLLNKSLVPVRIKTQNPNEISLGFLLVTSNGKNYNFLIEDFI